MKQKQDSDCDCSLHRPAVCKQKAVQCRQVFCFHQDTALQIPHHDQRKHNFVCGESEDKGKQDNPINSKSLSKKVPRKLERMNSRLSPSIVKFASSQIKSPAGAATAAARPNTNRVLSKTERTITLPICGRR